MTDDDKAEMLAWVAKGGPFDPHLLCKMVASDCALEDPARSFIFFRIMCSCICERCRARRAP